MNVCVEANPLKSARLLHMVISPSYTLIETSYFFPVISPLDMGVSSSKTPTSSSLEYFSVTTYFNITCFDFE